MYIADFWAKGTIDMKITSRPRTNDIGKWSIYKNVWRKIDPDAANLIHSTSMLIKNYDAHGFHFLLILQYQSCYDANCTEKYECISFPPLRFFNTFNGMFQNVCFFLHFWELILIICTGSYSDKPEEKQCLDVTTNHHCWQNCVL